MHERIAVGTAKYGTPLQTHNGRKPLVDAYQESLDLVVYLRQAIEEARDRDALAQQRTAGLDALDSQAAAFAALREMLKAVHESLQNLCVVPPPPAVLAADVDDASKDAAIDAREQTITFYRARLASFAAVVAVVLRTE